MGVPTIVSVSPTTGPTGGWTLVEITGTNFRLPTPPPPFGIVPPRPQSIAVLFGTKPAKAVSVLRSDLLIALTAQADPGPVGVTVKNIDDIGVPIPGETATLAAGFTFARPPLTEEDHLSRLIRALIQEIKRQVITNVAWVPHVDWSAVPASGLPGVSELPAIALVGPGLSENRLYSLNERQQEIVNPNVFDTLRTPLTCDLDFTVLGLSDSTQEMLNLLALTAQCFHRTKYLEVQRHPTNLVPGFVRYELDVPVGGGLKVASTPSESNIRQFNGRIIIRGFDFEGIAGVPDDLVVDRGGRVAEDGVIVQSERIG